MPDKTNIPFWKLFGWLGGAKSVGHLGDFPDRDSLALPGEESRDLAELGGRLNELAGMSQEKSLAYQDYAAWQNLDENGSFFGPEFSIRATAPRIKALFVNEPWVYTTATLIAKTLAGIPLKVYTTGTEDEVPNHPLARMLQAGSIYQSGKHQLWTGYLDLVLGGNFFLVVDQFYMSLTLAPVELVSINLGDVNNPGPDSITIANPSKMGTRYLVPYNRVIHLRLPNPNNPFYGLSPFAAASRPMLLDRYKQEYEMAFYLRGATNNGVIETTQDISKQRFERLMRSFEQTYTGKRNWWRTLFLPKGAVWKSASPNMKDMEHLEGLKENRKTILAVLGIPPSMVGLTEDVNYATSEAQMAVFYEATIIPMVRFIEDGFNNSQLLRNVYQGRVEVRADLSTIKALRDQGEWAVKGDIANKIKDFFWINEIRDIIFQQPPITGGDSFVKQGTGLGGGGNPDNSLHGLSADKIPGTVEAAEANKPMIIQGIICSKTHFKTLEEAREWVHEHGFNTAALGEDEMSYRFRQRDPAEFVPNSFSSMELADGVNAVVGKLRQAEDAPQATSGGEPTPPAGVPPADLPNKAAIKEAHHANLLGVESSYGKAYHGIYTRYLDNLFDLVRRAVKSKQDIAQYLRGFEDDLKHSYMIEAVELLKRAAKRGYAFGKTNTKGHGPIITKGKDDRVFTDRDLQAIDILEARKEQQRTEALKGAAGKRWQAFNETRTQQILALVEEGYNNGETLEDISEGIRASYDERYPDQAYTIARTEVLSALSAGVKAHVEDLQEVFTQVSKEWITVGDEHVRDDHSSFEALGAVAADYEYAPGLLVPRDYGADAGQVINCRCSLVNSIPSSATSRANAILDSDTP